MAWILPEHLRWCDASGRIVLLDLQSERYFCLPPDLGDPFRRAIRGHVPADDEDAVRTLVEEGCLREGATPFLAGPSLTTVVRDRPIVSRANASRLLTLKLIGCQLRIAFSLRFRSLAAVLERACRPGAEDCEQVPFLDALAASLAASQVLLRATDRCLVRALSVQTLCRRAGIPTILALGVRLHPFNAHAWVQLGDQVIVGDFEEVRLYTPIAAFG